MCAACSTKTDCIPDNVQTIGTYLDLYPFWSVITLTLTKDTNISGHRQRANRIRGNILDRTTD